MEYQEISKNGPQFLALTSLTPEQFEYLHLRFKPICEKYFRYRTLEGTYRKHPSSKEHRHTKLRGSENKLLFLLVYLKTNNLQQMQAVSFGVSQSKVSRITAVLLTLLNETLEKMGLSPHRDGDTLASSLSHHQGEFFAYDGIERGIQRNLDKDAQAEEYSGKKKATE